VTEEGVGVHLTRLRSRSFPVGFWVHPAVRSMASALRIAAVPKVVLSKSRRAAGVKLPAASDRLGVIVGGAMLPFVPVAWVLTERAV